MKITNYITLAIFGILTCYGESVWLDPYTGPASYSFSNLARTSSHLHFDDLVLQINLTDDLRDPRDTYHIRFYEDQDSTEPFYTKFFDISPGSSFETITTVLGNVDNNWLDLEGRFEIEIVSGSIKIESVELQFRPPSNLAYKQVFTNAVTFDEYTTNGTPHSWLKRSGYIDDFELADFQDIDGDNFLNWEEYIADTNPNDINDFLYCGYSNCIIKFSTSPLCIYGVEYCNTSLGVNSWNNLTNGIIGSGAEIAIPTEKSYQQCFFRVSAKREE